MVTVYAVEISETVTIDAQKEDCTSMTESIVTKVNMTKEAFQM